MAETKADHIVRSYAQELANLREQIVRMGGMVEAQVAAASAAVVHQDGAAASASHGAGPGGRRAGRARWRR